MIGHIGPRDLMLNIGLSWWSRALTLVLIVGWLVLRVICG